jgi:uncharacterized membrane protein
VTALLALQAIMAPDATAFGENVKAFVGWIRLAAEITGAAIIALGVVLALVGFLRALSLRQAVAYTDVRLTLGRYLALALEFQLGADILSTSIAPSWDQIGKLGAIAVIRTALNFFLTRELREAGHAVSAAQSAPARSTSHATLGGA